MEGLFRKKINWKSFSVVMHLWKIVNSFYKDYLKKPTIISTSLDFILSKTKPIIKLPTKHKQKHLAKSVIKFRKKEGDK